MRAEKCKKKNNKEVKQQGGISAYNCPCRYLVKSKADNIFLKLPINCVLNNCPVSSFKYEQYDL